MSRRPRGPAQIGSVCAGQVLRDLRQKVCPADLADLRRLVRSVPAKFCRTGGQKVCPADLADLRGLSSAKVCGFFGQKRRAPQLRCGPAPAKFCESLGVLRAKKGVFRSSGVDLRGLSSAKVCGFCGQKRRVPQFRCGPAPAKFCESLRVLRAKKSMFRGCVQIGITSAGNTPN